MVDGVAWLACGKGRRERREERPVRLGKGGAPRRMN
jgi:hypothetical protein